MRACVDDFDNCRSTSKWWRCRYVFFFVCNTSAKSKYIQQYITKENPGWLPPGKTINHFRFFFVINIMKRQAVKHTITPLFFSFIIISSFQTSILSIYYQSLYYIYYLSLFYRCYQVYNSTHRVRQDLLFFIKYNTKGFV